DRGDRARGGDPPSPGPRRQAPRAGERALARRAALPRDRYRARHRPRLPPARRADRGHEPRRDPAHRRLRAPAGRPPHDRGGGARHGGGDGHLRPHHRAQLRRDPRRGRPGRDPREPGRAPRLPAGLRPRMLRVETVDAYYGLSHVLQGVSLTVEAGEAVALLGRNGAGKTTTLKTIMAVVRARRGRITWNDADITGLAPYRIVQLGIGYVPEERRIFPNLSVYENLKMARLNVDGGRRMNDYLARVVELFPPLAERLSNKGRTLSGGEQQMLTMARSLGTEPKLLLIDEPTEGLMPAFVETISQTIVEIQRQGVAVLLVEQNTRLALAATQRVYLIEKGVIKHEARSADLANDAEARHRYLGV